METPLPNKGFIKGSELYGKYETVTAKTVRYCSDMHIQYFLLCGTSCESGNQVFSILCVLLDKERVIDSEFIFDVSSNRSDAEKIYSALSKNGVPPCTMLDVVNDML